MKQSKVVCSILLVSMVVCVGLPVWPAEGGYSTEKGTLAPYNPPTQVNGTGKKLLAMYIVGSDLESGGDAGTNDLNELIDGYNGLSNRSGVEVIVAFGGANKAGWKGMKFATMNQIAADGQDGAFGNAGNSGYLYVEDRAHMGDESSLQLFLEYVRDKYTGFDRRFIAMWDHGASYDGYGNDENFDFDALSLFEIDNAFTNSNAGMWDMLGFDSCLMATLEVGSIAKNHANYLVASEELEPGHGWNWTHVIQAWVQESSTVAAGKSMVENFVKDVHNYSSDGKTLSLVDLSKYANVIDKTETVAQQLATELATSDTERSITVSSAGDARAYGQESKADARVSIDLKHLARLVQAKTQDATLKAQLDELIEAIDTYVIIARQDGTRPNSFGVGITAPENDPGKTMDFLPSGYTAFQQAYQQVINGDQSAPQIVNQNENVDADSIDFAPETNAGDSPADPAFYEWLDEQYLELDNQYNAGQLTDEQYDAALVELESADESNPGYQAWLADLRGNVGNNNSQWNDAQDSFPDWFDDWYEDEYDDSQVFLASAQEPSYPFMSGERSGLVASHRPRPGSIGLQQVQPSVSGVSATFQDENLVNVFTAFGNVLTFDLEEDGNVDDWFLTIGSVNAFPTTTEGQYFTPAWNKKWYFMEYDANEETAYIPMYYSHQVKYAGIAFSVYEAEIDYRDADVDYSTGTYETDFDGNPVEFATVEFIVAPNNKIVDHNIKSYRYFSNGPNEEDGYILYDKKQRKFGVGDEVRFYAWYINLTREGFDYWLEESDLFTIAQEPVYSLDVLEFEDLDGNLLDYYYTMAAEDAAGFLTLTDPASAVLDTPVIDWSLH